MKKIILIIGFLLLILPQNSYAARLWSTGFELQSVVTGVEGGTYYDAVAISTATKRSGAASLSCPTGGDYFLYTFAAPSPTVSHYFRFYLNIDGYPTTAIGRIFALKHTTDSTQTASIKLNTNGTLELWDEDGGVTPAQLGFDSSVLQLATWYRIEVAFNYIGDQDNTITAYIDGVSFATGDDVGGTTADQPAFFTLGATGSTINAGIFIDDVAINDSTGTAQNGLPGAGSIVHLWPNAAGDTNTCNAGDYTSVDEMTPDDATSYAECDDANDILDVNMQASSVPGINSYDNITLVQVGVRHTIDTSGTISLTPRIMSQTGGTVLSGTAFIHDDTTWKSNGDAVPRNYKLISYTDPQNAGAWTPALLDTMQIGVIATNATPDAWVSTLWALVEYTAGTPPAAAVAATVRVIINNIKMIINGAKMIIP
jgi:hypothetical protein